MPASKRKDSKKLDVYPEFRQGDGTGDGRINYELDETNLSEQKRPPSESSLSFKVYFCITN